MNATESTMRVIYVRLLVTGAVLAAMLVLGAFGPTRAATSAHIAPHATASR